jgi:hypothetical protein
MPSTSLRRRLAGPEIQDDAGWVISVNARVISVNGGGSYP